MHSLLFSELCSTFDLSDTPWKIDRLEAKRTQGGLPSIRAVWQKQRWKTPEITESFGPIPTPLLPLVSEKMAINLAVLQSSAKRRSCSP